MTSMSQPFLCAFCIHRDPESDMLDFRCAAFPDGVPAVILSMEHDHRRPHIDDNGIRFELDDDIGMTPQGIVKLFGAL